jgi:hypothetical protein
MSGSNMKLPPAFWVSLIKRKGHPARITDSLPASVQISPRLLSHRGYSRVEESESLGSAPSSSFY